MIEDALNDMIGILKDIRNELRDINSREDTKDAAARKKGKSLLNEVNTLIRKDTNVAGVNLEIDPPIV